MLTVQDILKAKGDLVWGVSPETKTIDALRFMAERNVGALVVLKDKTLVGIISERDFVHQVARDRNCLLHGSVETYMTEKVFTVTPQQTIQEVMQLMTQKHIRHLPVIDGENMVGLISMRDVVDAIIGEQSSTIRNLEDYIVGGGYGK